MSRRVEFEQGLKRALGPEYVPPEEHWRQGMQLIAFALFCLFCAGLAWLAFAIPQ